MSAFNMAMKIVFLDGSWFVGKRELTWKYSETKGTHHFRVISASNEEMAKYVGAKIAVPISSVKFFELEY